MIRFALGPDGMMVPDLAGKLPGRGYWVVAERTALTDPQLEKRFSRAARQSVKLPEDLLSLLEKGLTERCCAILGLSRRAGKLTSGFERVLDVIRGKRAGLLIIANDAGQDGRKKLCCRAFGLPIISPLSGADMARALGCTGVVVYAVMSTGRLGDRLQIESRRLAGVRNIQANANVQANA